MPSIVRYTDPNISPKSATWIYLLFWALRDKSRTVHLLRSSHTREEQLAPQMDCKMVTVFRMNYSTPCNLRLHTSILLSLQYLPELKSTPIVRWIIKSSHLCLSLPFSSCLLIFQHLYSNKPAFNQQASDWCFFSISPSSEYLRSSTSHHRTDWFDFLHPKRFSRVFSSTCQSWAKHLWGFSLLAHGLIPYMTTWHYTQLIIQ